MRRLIALFLAMALLVSGCSGAEASEEKPDGRIQIVATLFPQYDFARQIAGTFAEVTLLLPPGVESHSFEPTPADIIRINNADLFIYTGPEMEPWAEKLIDGLEGNPTVLDISQNIPLSEIDPEAEHDGHTHSGADPHIWTDPARAMQMVDNLAAALCGVDPAHAGSYQTNAASYKAELDQLDQLLMQTAEQAEYQELVFGGRFALTYFAERYGLRWKAAFDSCSGETEPSAGAVAQIIDAIRSEGIPTVFYEELTDPKVARMISDETGAQMLLLHSCHNVSQEEFAEGATYLSLMRQNAENLKKGLNKWR